jgi:aerobic-type carbon monoxide dehydrogenase small subunit (CoxS/CutS family)
MKWPAEPGSLPGAPDEPKVVITVDVNGTVVTEEVPTRLHVADFLRQRLGLTGTHIGCEQGVCGMCTVLVDGLAVKSCLMFAPQLDGRHVQTVESIAGNEPLTALQQLFRDQHALQCGFCTPAFLMTATALARRSRPLPRGEIREELSGVMCRCTGYEGLVTAVEQYLGDLPEDSSDE